MIAYADALARLRELANERGPLESEEVPLASAVGRVCSEALASPEALPAFANSAVDGFAVRSSDTTSASPGAPVRLLVQGSTVAGDAPARHSSAETLSWEIMTGAPFPTGAAFDAAVKVEDVVVRRGSRGEPVEIELRAPVAPEENWRDAGEDFAPGAPVLAAGARIRPENLLALAALGLERVTVRRRPRIALIATGREVAAPGGATARTAPLPGTIRNSTAPYLLAALDGEIRLAGSVGDDPAEFTRVFKAALAEKPDVVITTGAVSMGKHDFIGPALADLGARLVFHKVSIRPGKPILVASFESGESGSEKVGPVVFGLPGNPASTVVGHRFFIEPYLRALLGMRERAPLRARLRSRPGTPEGVRCFLKARLENGEVELHRGQASFLVHPFAEANAWAVIPEECRGEGVGEWIDIVPFGGALD
jgi:molybdopterin molybdotransferase